MKRTMVALACLALGAVVSGAACEKGSAVSAGGGKIEGAAASALDNLPKETGLVVGFSWQKFKATKLFDMIDKALPPEAKAHLTQIKEACNLDLMNDVDSIVVAAGGNVDKDRALVLIKGKWDEDKMSKCATAMGPKVNKKVTTAKDGAITTYTVEGDHSVHVAWSGDTMILTPASMQGDKTYLADLLKVKSTVKDNKPFMEVLGKVDTNSTFYAAILPPPDSELATQIGKSTGKNEKMTAGWVSIGFAKDLNVVGGMRFTNDAEAKSVTEKMSTDLEASKKDPNFGQYISSASVSQSGADVTFKLSLTEKQVDELIAKAQGILPYVIGNMIPNQQ